MELFEKKHLGLVGLGNPGDDYSTTRHNIGFMIIDKIGQLLNCPFVTVDNIYMQADTVYSGQNVSLIKPLTYMNLSGEAIVELIDREKIDLPNLLVISDDFNLTFGKIRFRKSGSDGGHNGLASVISRLQTIDFPRLRFGIGQKNMNDAMTFVLSDFNASEKKSLPSLIDETAQACLYFIREGITKTMNLYN